MANDDTMNNFLAAVNAQNAATTVGFFGATSTGQAPTVGITDYAPSSPTFSGIADITTLFNRLFKTFPDFNFAQMAGSVLLYSDASHTQIAIQATMTGTHQARWFPYGKPHFSPPLSQINPSEKTQKMSVPVCAIFAFNNATNLICNLSLFFDRYRMQQQLQ